MPRNLKQLKQEDVQRNLKILSQLVAETNKDLPTGRGPFHDIVLYNAAMLATANQQDVADAMDAINVGRITRDPNNIPNALVDRVLSKWLIARKHGTKANGTVRLITKQYGGFIIPPGTQFSANGHTFRTHGVLHVRTNTSQLIENEYLLQEYTKGTWAVTIPVASIAGGASANLRRGTKLQFDDAQLPLVYSANTATDFVGGMDVEQNSEMLSRLTKTTGGKVWSNRYTCDALIRKHPKFERAIDTSIIGFGDPEMLRDRHSLWPGSTGGRVDVYIKPSSNILTKEILRPGRVTEITDDGTLWKIDIERYVAPGFYYIASVKRKEGTECTIIHDVRGFDTTENSPKIHNPLEAAFTAYQTMMLTVLEPAKKHKTDKISEFVLDLRYLAGIAELQEYLLDGSIASPASDVLVKAPIPCFTAVNLEIQRSPADVQVPVNAIKESVATYINKMGFVGRLEGPKLVGAVIDHLYGSMAVKDIEITGKIMYPDGAIETIKTRSVLQVPNHPQKLVSPKTVTFFQDPADVTVHVVTTDAFRL